MKGQRIILGLIGYSFIYMSARAQDSLTNTSLTLDSIWRLSIINSVQVKMAHTSVELSREQVEIEKLDRLPELSTSLVYGYLSNADIWNTSLSDHQKGRLPHPLTLFSMEARETLFAGGRISNAIRRSTLEAQIAYLRQEKDEMDIRFLVTAQYLDIYRLLNERKVYINNTQLARQRLKNILSLRRQGMVTLNDQLRTELIISDYELATRRIASGIVQLNNQLNIVLGLPDSVRLSPDTVLLLQSTRNRTIGSFLEDAYRENHELKISAREKEIAETNIRLLKGERLPEIGLIAQSDLQRPFLNSLPAIDVYYNVWRAGVGVKYNISSIYRSPRKIKAGIIALDLSRQEDSLLRQNVEVAVKNAFIKYTESLDELGTYKRDLHSAEENYRTVEKRYFSQLAILADLIDATNTKIEAEIKVANAEINSVYSYYELLKTVGTL